MFYTVSLAEKAPHAQLTVWRPENTQSTPLKHLFFHIFVKIIVDRRAEEEEGLRWVNYRFRHIYIKIKFHIL